MFDPSWPPGAARALCAALALGAFACAGCARLPEIGAELRSTDWPALAPVATLNARADAVTSPADTDRALESRAAALRARAAALRAREE